MTQDPDEAAWLVAQAAINTIVPDLFKQVMGGAGSAPPTAATAMEIVGELAACVIASVAMPGHEREVVRLLAEMLPAKIERLLLQIRPVAGSA